jgi:hypothetical protein
MRTLMMLLMTCGVAPIGCGRSGGSGGSSCEPDHVDCSALEEKYPGCVDQKAIDTCEDLDRKQNCDDIIVDDSDCPVTVLCDQDTCAAE